MQPADSLRTNQHRSCFPPLHILLLFGQLSKTTKTRRSIRLSADTLFYIPDSCIPLAVNLCNPFVVTSFAEGGWHRSAGVAHCADRLRHLYLSHNLLTSLSPSVIRLGQLRHLDLSPTGRSSVSLCGHQTGGFCVLGFFNCVRQGLKTPLSAFVYFKAS